MGIHNRKSPYNGDIERTNWAYCQFEVFLGFLAVVISCRLNSAHL